MNYKNIEEKCITIFKKYIKKGKINHAYLIETNIDDRISLAKVLVSTILEIEDVKQEIDDLYFNDDLKIIKTNQSNIKKEEIINLKESFKTKSIYNDNRIYIIEEAEKLTSSSSNTLLKFLEEPNQNIVAILITSNKNKVINTIVSRCQIIRIFLKENNQIEIDDNHNNLFEFLLMFEEKKEKSIAYFYKYFKKESLDRNIVQKLLNDILFVYDDVLHYKMGISLDYYEKYQDYIKKISEKNDIKMIKRKINTIVDAIDNIKYNQNVRLIIDKLIIDMSGVDLNV